MSESDESNTHEDAVTDSVTEKPKNDFEVEAPLSTVLDSSNPLITLEEAKKKIDSDILAVLSDKFKGKLIDIRCVDQNDILF